MSRIILRDRYTEARRNKHEQSANFHSRARAVAVQLALVYGIAAQVRVLDGDATDDAVTFHDQLLDHFHTWETLTEDLAEFARVIERWTAGRTFDNWYDLIDRFGQVYAEQRLSITTENFDVHEALLRAALRLTPAEEAR